MDNKLLRVSRSSACQDLMHDSTSHTVTVVQINSRLRNTSSPKTDVRMI